MKLGLCSLLTLCNGGVASSLVIASGMLMNPSTTVSRLSAFAPMLERGPWAASCLNHMSCVIPGAAHKAKSLCGVGILWIISGGAARV